MQDRSEQPQANDSKSSTVWIAAVWVSFLVWVFHSFAVRGFFESLHGAGKFWGGH